MSQVVMKFGGKSLANLKLINEVADYIAARLRLDKALKVVAVVSAMGNRTDEILGNIHALNPNPSPRELAAALQIGEAESAPYLAVALQARGIETQSYNALQLEIQTSGGHENARITKVNREKLLAGLEKNQVLCVTGFQGISETADDELVTLGRGGSDASAVAIAAILGTRVEFYKAGVAGVHAFDPRISLTARVLEHLSFEEALPLAEHGYEFLMKRSLEIARKFGVPLEFHSTPGLPNHNPWPVATVIDSGKGENIEDKNGFCALALRDSYAVIVLTEVPNIPGLSHMIFTVAKSAFYTSYQASHGENAVVCLVLADKFAKEIAAKLGEIEKMRIFLYTDLTKVTLINQNGQDETDPHLKVGKSLHEAHVNIQAQYGSRELLHTLVSSSEKEKAVLALAQEFSLREEEQSNGS